MVHLRSDLRLVVVENPVCGKGCRRSGSHRGDHEHIGGDLKRFDKLAWIILLFAFVFVESRAIDRDKQESRQEFVSSFQDMSNQANTNLGITLEQSKINLKSMLDDEHSNFAGVLSDEHKGCVSTLGQIFRNDQNENQRFTSLLSEQQKLFADQAALAASLNGRLLPATDPTPINRCTASLKEDQIAVITARNNTYVTDKFPHTIIQIQGNKVISIAREADGSLVLNVDMRDDKGRIIFRLDENGLRALPGIYLLRPDKSTVIAEDSYGQEVFRARYLNDHAFTITGIAIYGKQQYPLDNPMFTDFCSTNASGADIAIN